MTTKTVNISHLLADFQSVKELLKKGIKVEIKDFKAKEIIGVINPPQHELTPVQQYAKEYRERMQQIADGAEAEDNKDVYKVLKLSKYD